MRTELARVVDALPGLVWTALPDGRVDFVNRRWCEYTGQSVAQARAHGWRAAVHADDLPGLLERWPALPALPEPGAPELRLRSIDGRYRWFLARSSPLSDARGQVVGWCGINTDIDDRKCREGLPGERDRAEIALAGENQLLEMIASGRPLRDVLHALCTCFETAAAGCLCGVYPIDWSGPTFHDAVAPSLPASYLAPVEGLPVRPDVAPCGVAAQLGAPVIVEDIASDVRWRGSSYQAHVLAHGLRAVWSTSISSREGRVLGTFCIYRREAAAPSPQHRDLVAQVTHIASIALDRERREAALRRSEAFPAQAQRLTRTGSLWWKTATGELAWSEETFRLLEYPPTVTPTVELALNRCHPDDLPLVREKIAAAVRDGASMDFEHRLLMPNGGVKHVRVVFQKVAGDAGAREFVGAATDITEWRRAEEKLRELRAELAHVARVTSLGTLTASIAHEVNQPLSGIVTNASTCLRMLASDPPNVDGARETARRAIRDGNRASDVISRLRALFSNREFTLEPFDLNEATRELIALAATDLQRHDVVLRAELADGLPLVAGDRIQLQQVILNLLRNAADAMADVHDRPRELVVRTACDGGDDVRLTVRDTGVGLAPESSHSLFDAFYTTKTGGMGIGLFVSRSIVERHHGRLWAEPNDGPGATFAFSIPRA